MGVSKTAQSHSAWVIRTITFTESGVKYDGVGSNRSLFNFLFGLTNLSYKTRLPDPKLCTKLDLIRKLFLLKIITLILQQ